MKTPAYSVKQRPDRDNQWYVYFRDLNKKQKKVCLHGVKTSAQAQRDAWRVVKESLESLPIPEEKKGSEASVAGEFQRWMRLNYTFKKPTTVKAVQGDGKAFFRYLRPSLLEECTRQEINHATEAILASGISPKYWKNCLSTLKSFFAWVVSEKLLQEDPVRHLKPPSSSTFKRDDEVWTEEEVVKTAKHLKEDDKVVFLLMRYTGMYPSDLYHFRKKHIVKDKEQGYKILKVREKAKTGTEVIDQPLLPQIEKLILEAYEKAQSAEDKLFVHSDRSVTVWVMGYRKRVATAYKKAFNKKMKKLKSLRHTFATWIMEKDVPIDVAKAWMGHSKNSTMLEAVYTHRKSAVQYVKLLK